MHRDGQDCNECTKHTDTFKEKSDIKCILSFLGLLAFLKYLFMPRGIKFS